MLKSKKLFHSLAILALLLFGGTVCATSAAGSLTWQHQLPDAINQATSAHKWIFVDVYIDSCLFCKRLDKETYVDPAVVQYLNKSFVCVKLNAEDGGGGRDFAKQYSIRGFPCMVLLDSSGKYRGMIRGYKPPHDFMYAMSMNTLNQPGFKP